MSSWMSGEVRFTKEGGHRVPHDPLLGLDRSIDMLEQVLDSSMPFSTDESTALLLMGNAHSRRGNFPEAVSFYKQALTRNLSAALPPVALPQSLPPAPEPPEIPAGLPRDCPHCQRAANWILIAICAPQHSRWRARRRPASSHDRVR